MMMLALSACGGKSPDGAGAAGSSASAPMRAFGGDDAVAAVRESAGTPSVQLRFVLDTRPVVDKPFRLQLVASAAEPIPQLWVSVESAGLNVDPASVALVLTEAGSSTPQQFSARHDLTVLAHQAGLAEVTVRMVRDADSPEMIYIIPVLVAGAESTTGPQAPVSDKSDPAPKGNDGQPEQG
jgi:hypothetical protein